MTFEDWGPAGYGIEDFSHAEKSAIKRMYADWKAERGKLIEALEKADATLFSANKLSQGPSYELQDTIMSGIVAARHDIAAILAEVEEQG